MPDDHEEWPVAPNWSDQPLPPRPVHIHPQFGYNWSIHCPHCGGQVKVYALTASYATHAYCWVCRIQARLILPIPPTLREAARLEG